MQAQRPIFGILGMSGAMLSIGFWDLLFELIICILLV
jgi:hypothetical protein